MLDADHLQQLRAAFRAHSFFLRYVSDRAQAVLDTIIDHPRFAGVSDPSALLMLATLLQATRPPRVLQLGTHIGFSAIVIADILAHNAPPGTLITVDPEESAHELARSWVAEAGLAERMTLLDGASTEPRVTAALDRAGPFDLIYLDSSHAYQATLEELDRILAPDGWLAESGLLVLHDAGLGAAQWDPTAQGGVRRALEEWMARHAARCQMLVLEPPLWPNICGLGLVARRPAQAQVLAQRFDSPLPEPARVRIAELEHQIAVKNEHIERLEALLHRIEHGRLMRVLRWMQR